MNWDEIRKNKWFIIFCLGMAGAITVLVYLLFKHLGPIASVIGKFIGFFKQVIIGGILAYLVNPIAGFIKKKLFKNTKLKDGGWGLSVALALIMVVLLLVVILGLVVPQLVASALTFTEQFKKYYPSLTKGLVDLGIDLSLFGLSIGDTSQSLKDTISALTDLAIANSSTIRGILLGAGSWIVDLAISVILSVYLISEKTHIKEGTERLIKALVNEKRGQKITGFFARCSEIFLHYVYYSLIEGVLIGFLNAVFMLILRMPFVSLVSVVVGVCNLIPTVGPIIGAVIGGFVLVLENPMHALVFLIFTVILQFFDGYILKPKLFGNSLGVSSALIMVGVVVGGNIFGILGILLSIPAVAIIDVIYHEYILKSLENRRKRKSEVSASK